MIQQKGTKWIIGILLFITSTIALCSYIIYAIVHINNLNNYSNKIDQLLILSNKATNSAHHFMINAYADTSFVNIGSNTHFNDFFNLNDSLVNIFEEFEKEYAEAKLYDIKPMVARYKEDFIKLSKLYKKRGFKDYGLEGSLRKAIHNIEKHPGLKNKENLLMLRRHEKDFLLRKDIQYVKKFEEEIIKFKDEISKNNKMDEVDRLYLVGQLENYNALFSELVNIEKEIGLTEQDGLRNSFIQNLNGIEYNLSKLNEKINKQKATSSFVVNVIILSVVLIFTLMLIGVIWGINYMNESVIKPIHQLNDVAQAVARGQLNLNLNKIKRSKLLEDLIISFELILQKIKNTMKEVENISNRTTKTELKLQSAEDEIGKILNAIIVELKQVDKQTFEQNYINEGLATFAKTLRQEDIFENINRRFLSDLIKYLGCNQGGLYIYTENKLVLACSYAYDRQKYQEREIEIGEGLLGQAYLEKDIVYMTDIPDEYLYITSGLGNANPRALLIVPFMYNDEVMAMLEVASFTEIENYKIDFLLKVGEIYGSMLYSKNQLFKTNALLNDLQLKSEQLHAQEEEMRQNMEELMALQEESLRKERQKDEALALLTDKNIELEATLKKYKSEIEILKQGKKYSELSRKHEDYLNIREEIHKPVFRHPRRIEYFLD